MTETKTAIIPGKIFVRNLSHLTAKKDIKALFARIGPLTETKMSVDKLKRQLGFVFVTFKTAEHATNAISTLNGTSLQGWKLHLLPFIAKEPPRASLKRDATAGETPRRSGHLQHKATLAEMETTQEPGRILVLNLDRHPQERHQGNICELRSTHQKQDAPQQEEADGNRLCDPQDSRASSDHHICPKQNKIPASRAGRSI